MSRFKNIISKFHRKHIMVVGDVILDRYIRGSVSRISPEAPVVVVLQEGNLYNTPGGAANVAHNLSALGAKVTLVGRMGNDFEGQLLKRTLKQKGIDTSGIIIDKSAPTITKTRVMAQHQQVVRIDREVKAEIDEPARKKIFHYIETHIKDADAIIISDYGKGLITPELLSHIKSLAAKHEIIVAIDPKVEHFSLYKNVTTITPNLKEAENAIRNIKITDGNGARLKIKKDKLETDEDINLAGAQLQKYLNVECLVITLGERGMRVFERNKAPVSIKTQAREVFDVSGAGDTVISVFTLALACNVSHRKAAELANAAAGVVVGKMGAVAITNQELLEAS